MKDLSLILQNQFFSIIYISLSWTIFIFFKNLVNLRDQDQVNRPYNFKSLKFTIQS